MNELFYQKDRRYKDFTENDIFEVESLERLIFVDHQDILKSEIEVQWIGFHGMNNRYSIEKILNSDITISLTMLH